MSIFDDVTTEVSGSSQSRSMWDYEPVEQDWEWNPLDRMEASVQSSFGALWGAASAVADTVGWQGASDWAADRAGLMFEKAAEHDLVETSFQDVLDNPAEVGKYGVELITNFIPDLAMMFMGGAGLGSMAGKAAAKGYGTKAVETMLHKGLAKNMKKVGTEWVGESKEAIYKEAIRRTAGDAARLVGVSGIEGMQGAGQAYLMDVQERGEEANPWTAIGTGTVQAGISMLNPLNKVLAGKMPKGKTNILQMTVGEAAEEMGQEIPAMAHEAGIRDDITFGELINSDEGRMRLIESGVAGAMLGTTFGGGLRAVTGGFKKSKEETIDDITNSPESVLEDSTVDTSGDVKAPEITELLAPQGAMTSFDPMQGPVASTPDPTGGANAAIVARKKEVRDQQRQFREDAEQMMQAQVDEAVSKRMRLGGKATWTELSDKQRQTNRTKAYSPDLPGTASQDAFNDDVQRKTQEKLVVLQEQRAAEQRAADAERILNKPEPKGPADKEPQGMDRKAGPSWTSREGKRQAAARDAIAEADLDSKDTNEVTLEEQVETKFQEEVKDAKASAKKNVLKSKPKEPKKAPKEPVVKLDVKEKNRVQNEKKTADKITNLRERNTFQLAEAGDTVKVQGKPMVKTKEGTLVDPEKVKVDEAFVKETKKIKAAEDTNKDVSADDAVIEAKAKQVDEQVKEEQKETLKSGKTLKTSKDGWQYKSHTHPDGTVAKTYHKGDSILLKVGDKKFALVKNDKGTRDNRGIFDSMSDAKKADEAGLTSEQFYKPKKSKVEQRAEKPLTATQTALLEKLPNGIGEAVSKALAASGNPSQAGVEDAAATGILDAARTFKAGTKDKKGNEVKFESYAHGKALGAIKDFYKKGENTQEMQVTENAKDSDGQTMGGSKVEETTTSLAEAESMAAAEPKRAKRRTSAQVKADKVKEDKAKEEADWKTVDTNEKLKAEILARQKAARTKGTMAEVQAQESVKEKPVEATTTTKVAPKQRPSGPVASGKKTGAKTPAQISAEESKKPKDSFGSVITNVPKGAKIKQETVGEKVINRIVSYAQQVYHGTPADFDGNLKTDRPIFMTERKSHADTYAEAGGQIVSRKVDLKNPLVVDWKGKGAKTGPDGSSAAAMADKIAKEGKHDGILFLNIVDPGPRATKGYNREPGTQVAVFSNKVLKKSDVPSEAASKTKMQMNTKTLKEDKKVAEENKKTHAAKQKAKEPRRVENKEDPNAGEPLVTDNKKLKTVKHEDGSHRSVEDVQVNFNGELKSAEVTITPVYEGNSKKASHWYYSIFSKDAQIEDSGSADNYMQARSYVNKIIKDGSAQEEYGRTKARQAELDQAQQSLKEPKDIESLSEEEFDKVKDEVREVYRLKKPNTFKTPEEAYAFADKLEVRWQERPEWFKKEQKRRIEAEREAQRKEDAGKTREQLHQEYLDDMRTIVAFDAPSVKGKKGETNLVVMDRLDLTPAQNLGLQYLKTSGGDFDAAISRLERANLSKGDMDLKAEALESLNTERAKGNKKVAEFEAKYPNALSLIEKAIKSPDKVTSRLAKMIYDDVDWDKLQDIKVTLGRGGSYTPSTNTITLRENANHETMLHEAVHGITSRELNNPKNIKFRKRINSLLSVAKTQAVKDGFMSREQMRKLSGIETSQDFQRELNKDSKLRKLYGFTNIKEFLSEATSNKEFQNFLKTVYIKKSDGMVTTLWKKMMSYIGDALGIPKGKYTVLEDVFSLIPEISRQDALAEGEINYAMDVPADRPPPKTRKEQTAIMMKNDIRGNYKAQLLEFVDRTKRLAKDIGKSTTEVIRKVSPVLLRPLREMEFNINYDNKRYQNAIRPFVDKYNRMPKKDRLMLDLVLMNNKEEDVADRVALLKKHKMTAEYNKVEAVLAEIHKEKGKVGLNHYKDRKNYFPRRVKDVRKLMQDIQNDPNFNIIQAELDRLGSDATQAEKENALQQMINTGRFPALGLVDPTSSKRRTINRVSSEWKHHYSSSSEALLNHIYESSEAIHSRKLFGDVYRKKRTDKLNEYYERLEGTKETSIAKRKELVGRIQLLEAELENYDEEFNSGIAATLQKLAPELNTEQADEVIGAIRGRLTERGMHGPAAALRNLSLMSVLSSPTSAITQIGDLAFSIYKYGLTETGASILGKNLITANDLDLTGSMTEFQQEGSAKWLDKSLKWSGLKTMDQFGKNTTMNAALNKAKKMSLTQFTEKFGEFYGDETVQTYKDIKAGKKTKHSMFFAFNELSELQPVSLSEMPLKYLQAGNGRIFYALKSYNIKAINTIYRESVHAWRTAKTKGEKMQAAKNTGKLIMLMTLAGATADELKDFLLGKDAGTFSDNVHENFLKIGMMSRYSVDKMGSQGGIKTLMQMILPPTQMLDDPMRDLLNLGKSVVDEDQEITYKSIKSMPWGKLFYEWLPEGTAKDMGYLKTEITDKIREGEAISSQSDKVRTYNKWARGQKDQKPIKYGTLVKARRDYLKDQ